MGKLKGSKPKIHEKRPLPDGEPHKDNEIEVSLLLRCKNKDEWKDHCERMQQQHPVEHISFDEFESRFGASQEDIDKVKQFAAENHLDVVEIDAGHWIVILKGTIEKLNKAFNVRIRNYKYSPPGYPEIKFYASDDHISIPGYLDGIVTGVLGLHNFPILRPPIPESSTAPAPDEVEAQGKTDPYPSTDLAEKYNFPKDLTGKGQSIAIFAGQFWDNITVKDYAGYNINDLEYYFDKIVPVPAPGQTIKNIIPISGDEKAKNSPGAFCQDCQSVYQNIEIIGSIAPDAKIYVYFSDGRIEGNVLNTFRKMVNNSDDKKYNHRIICCGWDVAECLIGHSYGISEHFANQMGDLFSKAAAHKITICVASGDYGSSACCCQHETEVNFFTSSPYILSCGGTMFKYPQNTDLKNIPEVAWKEDVQYIESTEFCDNSGCDFCPEKYQIHGKCPINEKVKFLNNQTFASGGGESTKFKMPGYQKDANVKTIPSPPPNRQYPEGGGRLTPDVAAYASYPGYLVYLSKIPYYTLGTTPVVPLFAALFALINEKLGAEGKQLVGFINPLLYKLGKAGGNGVFNDIEEGNNDYCKSGYYQAAAGWDACTGWGSIDGSKLLEYLLKNQPDI